MNLGILELLTKIGPDRPTSCFVYQIPGVVDAAPTEKGTVSVYPIGRFFTAAVFDINNRDDIGSNGPTAELISERVERRALEGIPSLVHFFRIQSPANDSVSFGIDLATERSAFGFVHFWAP